MIELVGAEAANEIKKELAERVASLGYVPRLAIIVVGDNSVSQKFVSLKEAYARDIGIETRTYEFSGTVSTNELRTRMNDIVHEALNSGVIVQLPLPEHIDTQAILNAVVLEKDVDVLSARAVGNVEVEKSKILAPVASAIEILFQNHGVEVVGKKATVIGYGRLVGKPVASWLVKKGALVTIAKEPNQFDPAALKNADIIISGVGSPKLVTGDMVKEGAVVVDVGTSEMNGEVMGDIDFDSVAKVAGLLTPKRGGVGPLTIAMVFKNLLTLIEK